MKKFAVILILYVAVLTARTGYTWAPVSLDIHNRGYFHLRKAEEFYDTGDYWKAIEELDFAYGFFFDRKDRNLVVLKKIVSFMKLGSYDEAIETIEKLQTEDDIDNEFFFLKAECLQRIGKTTEAISILDTLITEEWNEKNKEFLKIKEALLFLSIDSLGKAGQTFSSVLNSYYPDKEAREEEREQLKLIMFSLGYIALKKGNYENAELHFKYLEKYFGDEEVSYKFSLYLAFTLGIEGKEKESFSILETIDSKNRGEVSVMEGYLFYRNGSYSQALEKFKSIENDINIIRDTREMITILSGECCYFLGDYSEAIMYYREYNELVNRADLRMSSLYGLSWSYFRLGQYSNAYAVLKDFLVLYPESPYLEEIERLSALSLYYIGEHRQAKYHFTRLLSIDNSIKDRDKIHYLRGKSRFYLREFVEAESDFSIVISHFAKSRWKPFAMNMIARISFEKEEYLNAYNTYKKLLVMELPPRLLDEVRFQTERCLLHLGYHKNPVEMSRAFVEKYPLSSKSADLQLEVAEYYFQLQKYWEAIREYERFLNLFPKNRDSRFALFKLSQSYSQIGYSEKALDICRELSEGKDEYAESALISIGDILFSHEKHKESITAFKELTKKFPESSTKDYANFMIGKNYLELNLPREAKVSFKLVVGSRRIFPFKENAKLLIAQTLYMEGRGEEYLVYLDNLVKTGSRKLKAESYFLKAEYKRETGRFKEAMNLYKQSSYAYEEKGDRVQALYMAGLSAEELMLFDEAKLFYRMALEISVFESERFGIQERIKRIEAIKGENSD